MADNNVGEVQPAVGADQDNLIKCPSLVGNTISEGVLKSLVSRGSGADVLAEACRSHGYTTGSARGSLLTIDSTSGKVITVMTRMLGVTAMRMMLMTMTGHGPDGGHCSALEDS